MEKVRPVDGLRCLVTGSAGFVGNNLVRALLERGCEVHGFDRAPASIEDPKLPWFRGEFGLLTTALRPGSIYGPGERNMLIGPMVKALKQGVPVVVFGDGATRMDYTYIDNLVDAQIRAAERLVDGSPVCGQAYFVTDGDPINTGDFSQTLVGQMGLDVRTMGVPGRVARAIESAGERVFQLFGRPKPPVSIVEVELCVRDSYFSIDSARRDLEYRPIVNTREGLRRTDLEAREYYDSL